MELNFRDISAGAMTAAVSLGTAAQAIGGGAVGAVATAANQVTAVAASTAAHVGANVAHVGVVAGATSQVHSELALVQKPLSAAAKGLQRSTMLQRAATVLGRALPVVAIGASTLSGASVIQEQGVNGLFTSRQGRSAVLGSVGGALLLVPTPATQIAAAVTLGALAVNEFGGMDRLGRTTSPPAPNPPVPQPAAR